MTDVIASLNVLEFFNTTQTSTNIGAINSTFLVVVGCILLLLQSVILMSRKAAIGAFTAGLTIDTLGRRRTYYPARSPYFCNRCYPTMCGKKSCHDPLVGRIVAGWAVGILSMSVPVSQAECAHPRSRGL
jgi:hypothetical protein